MSVKVWDYTSLNTFLNCRRKYYWWGVRHLQPMRVAPALEFGKSIHSSLDIYYANGIDKAIENFRETYKDTESETLRTLENGVKLLKWYAKVYKNEPFKVMGKPEVGFVFPIGDVLWGGRIDLPVDWDGQLYIIEHKTTSVLRANYSKQFDLSDQVSSYILAAEEFLDRKCMGCVINVLEPWKELKRPTARSKTPEQHFIRIPITRSERQKEEFKRDVQQVVRDIHKCVETGEFYPNHSQCFSYNYDCPYKQLCMYGEDERIIKKDYRVEAWEPYKQLIGGGEDEKGREV